MDDPLNAARPGPAERRRRWISPVQRRELRRGGRVLLACAIGLAFGVSVFGYLSSLFVTVLSERFGWSRAALGP